MIMDKLDKLFKGDGKTPEQKKLQKDIAKYVMSITGLAIRGKLTNNDVNKLERMYESYYILYPNDKSQKSSEDKIRKLRGFVKKR